MDKTVYAVGPERATLDVRSFDVRATFVDHDGIGETIH